MESVNCRTCGQPMKFAKRNKKNFYYAGAGHKPPAEPSPDRVEEIKKVLADVWVAGNVSEVTPDWKDLPHVYFENKAREIRKLSVPELTVQLANVRTKINNMTFARVDIEGKPEVGAWYDGYLACKKDILAIFKG